MARVDKLEKEIQACRAACEAAEHRQPPNKPVQWCVDVAEKKATIHEVRCRSASPLSGKRLGLAADGQAGEVTNKAAHVSQTHHILPVSPASAYQVRVSVLTTPVSCILDTGAAVTRMHNDVWKRVNKTLSPLSPWNGSNLVSVEGTQLNVLGSVKLPLQLVWHGLPSYSWVT